MLKVYVLEKSVNGKVVSTKTYGYMEDAVNQLVEEWNEEYENIPIDAFFDGDIYDNGLYANIY